VTEELMIGPWLTWAFLPNAEF